MRPHIDLIQAELKKRNWSGNKLAMKMGVSRMEVSRLLRGERIGGRKCIGGLIRAFPEIPIEQLYFLE